ncbi:MAG: YggT family protein [Chloroflexi bacterium]|nr:YggT family protein [Chloroflexota bacterium]
MAQQPDIDPVDRREQVRVDRSPGGAVRRQRVVRDEGAERQNTIARINQIIWIIFGIIIGLIAFRIVLRLIVANPEATFAQFVYSVTDVFLWPFFGLTATPTTTTGVAFEVSSVIAMVVYALAAWVLTLLVRALFSKTSVRKVETYESE